MFYAENALATTKLQRSLERRSALAREYLLTSDDRALRGAEAEERAFDTKLLDLRTRTLDGPERTLVDDIDVAAHRYAAMLADTLQNRADPAVRSTFEREVTPAKAELETRLANFEALKEQQFEGADRASSANAERAVALVSVAAALAMIAAIVLTVLLRRGVNELSRGRATIAASLARVEQANRDLDAFAGRVAHDLRGALSPLLLAPSLLRKASVCPERLENVCARIDRAVAHAVALVDALLAFSRAGGTIDPDAFAGVSQVVADALEELEPKIAQSNATVDLSLEDADVRCPKGLLQVLTTNLIGNATKFVRGRTLGDVKIRGHIAQGGYALSVEDTGPGIPEDAQRRIFEPFYRVPGTQTTGTGIGLATVLRIVDAIGGRISVQSALGEGSRFDVWLPLAEPASDREASTEPSLQHVS